jgi:hypothetical protein
MAKRFMVQPRQAYPYRAALAHSHLSQFDGLVHFADGAHLEK